MFDNNVGVGLILDLYLVVKMQEAFPFPDRLPAAASKDI